MIATEKVQQQRPKPVLMAMLFAIVYPLGALGFFSAWLGWQGLSADWYNQPLLLYALIGALGSISSFALLLWRKRWGVYGLIATWATTAFLNILSLRPLKPDAIALGLLLIAVFLLEVRRSWRFLD